MKTVLITGAGGFIGRSLAAEFLKRGNIVYGVDVFPQGMVELGMNKNFTPILVDKQNFDALDAHDLHDLDIVYHLGWAGKLGGSDLNDYAIQDSNIQMTKKLLDKLVQIRPGNFVFCGSISHYKFMKDVPVEVNSDLYGLAKRYAADISMNILRRNNLLGNIVMLANTFGVGDQSSKAVNTLIRKFFKHEQLSLIDGDIPNDWVYIEDTVHGLIAAGEHGVPFKTYYIGHRRIATFRDNMTEMKCVLDSDLELPFGTYNDVTYADYSKVDLDALFEDTGFECNCDFRASLRKTAEWLKKQDEGGEL
ncbi:NAD(P)-dependent oxidoreductase [Erysipelotrichaceae bacterium AF15-26LB]|nr:NAD dependent epimerase/dehydratase family protein [Erysipelotrichaceae bacterium 3_1_53]MCR0350171.1 NAD(P)-dependent oxidoreductase [[Clostridium] innocuum]RJV84294.1 NAD(P)-dependent oxidoreductase [Erysipelotrichaceae bacterium AF15-26LB]RJV84996.1 NAD(P)-dependent oxidoreductase [Erysipelotrichaceae bacterium AF19-24AC]